VAPLECYRGANTLEQLVAFVFAILELATMLEQAEAPTERMRVDRL
jgi:hypothetical protein